MFSNKSSALPTVTLRNNHDGDIEVSMGTPYEQSESITTPQGDEQGQRTNWSSKFEQNYTFLADIVADGHRYGSSSSSSNAFSTEGCPTITSY